MKNNFCKVDHKTRPEISYNYLRQKKNKLLVQVNLHFPVTGTIQEGPSTLADVAGSRPALMNGMVLGGLDIRVGTAFLVALLPSRVPASCLRTWLCLLV